MFSSQSVKVLDAIGRERHIAAAIQAILMIEEGHHGANIAPAHQVIHFRQTARFKDRCDLPPFLDAVSAEQYRADNIVGRKQREHSIDTLAMRPITHATKCDVLRPR